MTLTLAANINATTRRLRVTGSVAGIQPGYAFRLDDELLTLQGFISDGGRYQDPTGWYVNRGQDGSTAATHTAGADILGATDAFASSDSGTTPPSPWSGGSPSSSNVSRLGPYVVTFEDFPTQGVYAEQSITASGVVSGGTWTPSFNDVVGDPVDWNADSTAMSAALEAIPELTSQVIVTGGPWPVTPFSVQILPVTGGAPEPLIAVDDNSLSGSTPGVVIATTTVGVEGGPPKTLVTLPDGSYVYSVDIDWASFDPFDTSNSLYIGESPVIADGDSLNYWTQLDPDSVAGYSGIQAPNYSGVQAGGVSGIRSVQVINGNPVQVIIDQASNPAPPAFGSMTVYLLVGEP